MQMSDSWGELRLALTAGLAATALLFAFPFFLLRDAAQEPPALLPPSPVPAEGSAPPSREPVPEPVEDARRTVRVLLGDGTVEEQTLADYLWSVTAAEMPASFEPDALRAQAVCARTYTLWRMGHPGKHEGADICTDSGCCQAYVTRENAAARWEGMAEEYAAKISAAVADTDGVAALYNGAPIQALFFSSSPGRTEDAAAVWGNSFPYLVPVDSPEGDEVPNYRSTVVLTAAEVKQRVLAEYPSADLSGKPGKWFSEVSYTDSGRVESLRVGGAEMSGGAARNLFGLRSACFTVSYGGDGFTFSVTGYGHGVGLSQYGANAMAKAGSTWQEILQHYYTGVTLGPGW